MSKQLYKNMKIKAIFTDLDGVLTDGGMYYQSIWTGDVPAPSNSLGALSFKKFHTRDASAAKWLSENTNVKLFVITAGDFPANNAINEGRMRSMCLTKPIFQGVADKASHIRAVASRFGMHLSDVAYIGDDRIDLPALKLVGTSACPADALSSIQQQCCFISHQNGGGGVLGDMIDRWILCDYIQETENVCSDDS